MYNVFQYICCAKVDENNNFTSKYQRIHVIWVPYKLSINVRNLYLELS